MNLTVKQLKVFVKLYELRSFTETADALFMTQSAVSKLCAELEDEVGFALFERSTRKVEPMDGATDLYRFAIEILGTLDAAARSLADLTSVRRGSVSIAAAPMIFHGLICDVMAEYHRTYPHVRLEAHEVSTDVAIEYVLNGRVDFGVVAPDRDDPRLLTEPIQEDRLFLACPADHPMATARKVTWRRIADENVIMLRSDNNMGRMVEAIMREQREDFQPMVEAGALSTLLSLVRTGIGVAVVPAYVVSLAEAFNLSVVPIEGSQKYPRMLSLIRRGNGRPSIAAGKLSDMLMNRLRKTNRFCN
ncbi:LysR family transcriptional regulator [Paraburkholderia sp. GAS334]|uniref:LysR family transcriptional regulator n=1 Tax=Paraburkholderia sp. GAS334 TaxID=3035131 RepID=UPI003D1B0F30